MKPPLLRPLSSSRCSVLLTWAPEPVLSSRASSSSLLQRTPRQSRSSLTSSDDRKVSRTSLASSDTPPPPPRRSLRTPMESCDETPDTPESTDHNKEFYTLQRKDKLLGWTTVYWGYKNEVEIIPLAPGEVHRFRLKATTEDGETEWGDPLTTTTKDDIVSAASLHRALDQGHLSSARKLIALRLQALEIPSKLGRTPLAVASARGDCFIAGMLLTCGSEINAQELGSQRTPLMTAAFRGAPDLLQLLKERDASWTIRDRFGQTPLHYGAMNSKLIAVQMAAKESPDVNVKDFFGWTPLMQAVSLSADFEVIEFLLNHGSDPSTCDKRGQTALMQAVLSGRPEIIQLLIEKGANKESENIYGHTAYDFGKNSMSKEMQNILPLLECKNLSTGNADGTIITKPKQAIPL